MKKVFNIDISKTLKDLNKIIVYIFVFLFILAFPFYYKNGYYNIGFSKWAFFRFLTLGTIRDDIYYPGLLLIASSIEIVYLLIRRIKYHEKIKLNKLDILVFSYFIIVFISRFLAYDKWIGWLGYKGWYMGLFGQLAFVLVYYFVSRYFKFKKDYLSIWMSINIIIYSLEILNRFWIYIPNNLIIGLSRERLINLVSTIGNINWFATYLAITFPIAYILFIFDDDQDIRYFSLISIFISAMSFITQGSQSMIFAFGGLLFILLFFCLKNKIYLNRYFIILITIISSFIFIGILRNYIFKDVVRLDRTFEYLMNIKLIIPLLILLIIIYYLFIKYINENNIYICKKISIILIIIFSSIILIYTILNNIGYIPDKYSLPILKFNDSWGTNRGEIWRLTFQTLIKMYIQDPIRIIFGAGPDNYYYALYYYCFDEVKIHWLNTALVNAHNEWLNSFVNYGIVGGLLYLSIFINGIKQAYKNKDYKISYIFMFMLICYMLNNIFSFQQAVSTPIAFFVLALINQKD